MKADDFLDIDYDALGSRYYCKLCGYSPCRVNDDILMIGGWGKSQRLRKMVRDHIKEVHLEPKSRKEY